jgi:hypothetical protein
MMASIGDALIFMTKAAMLASVLALGAFVFLLWVEESSARASLGDRLNTCLAASAARGEGPWTKYQD